MKVTAFRVRPWGALIVTVVIGGHEPKREYPAIISMTGFLWKLIPITSVSYILLPRVSCRSSIKMTLFPQFSRIVKYKLVDSSIGMDSTDAEKSNIVEQE